MLLLLSVLPSIILFIIVWKGDRIEKEPPKLLLKLFLFGALTTISASVIEILFENVILSSMNQEGILFAFIDNFLVVALAEEAGKYFVLKKVTWKHPAFNYTFDAIVYAVVVSLGFATLENILYLIEGSMGIAIARGLLSVPSHFIDALYMGCYYGLARYSDAFDNESSKKKYLRLAFWVPVLIHGFYDFCLSTGYGIFLLIFIVFEIVITILAIKRFLLFSRITAAIPGDGGNYVTASSTSTDAQTAPSGSETGHEV